MSHEHLALIRSLAQALLAAVAAASLDKSAPGTEIAGTDHWLTPAEAAQRMGVSVRWLSRRWRKLPFCHALPGGARGYRVSAAELQVAMLKR
jgi:hypothetical protein